MALRSGLPERFICQHGVNLLCREHGPAILHHSYNVPKSVLFLKDSPMAEAITKRSVDYSQWYLDIVKNAGMAENSDVRGCMVIKPHGYAIWEKMQRALDNMFKSTG